MNCGCGISFMKQSCDAVHLDRLPSEGMAGMLYVIGDTEEAAVYVWDGSKFVAVSGDDICCDDLYGMIRRSVVTFMASWLIPCSPDTCFEKMKSVFGRAAALVRS